MKKMTLDTTLAIADDLLSGERGVQIIQHLEVKAAAGDQDTWIRALFAGVYEALRLGVQAGMEHGAELANDRIAAVRPSAN